MKGGPSWRPHSSLGFPEGAAELALGALAVPGAHAALNSRQATIRDGKGPVCAPLPAGALPGSSTPEEDALPGAKPALPQVPKGQQGPGAL